MANIFDLTGRVAVVTGCSTGLGVQMAKALANQGCNIVAIARRQNLLDEVCADIEKTYGVKTLAVKLDITDTAAVDAATDEILAKMPKARSFYWTTTEYNKDCAWFGAIRGASRGALYKGNKFYAKPISKF